MSAFLSLVWSESRSSRISNLERDGDFGVQCDADLHFAILVLGFYRSGAGVGVGMLRGAEDSLN